MWRLFWFLICVVISQSAFAVTTLKTVECCSEPFCTATSVSACAITCSHCYTGGIGGGELVHTCLQMVDSCPTVSNPTWLITRGELYDIYSKITAYNYEWSDDENKCVCNPVTEYACSKGYYPVIDTYGGAWCTSCPRDNVSDCNGTSDDYSTSISSCYLPAGRMFADDTGYYEYDENCYYTADRPIVKN
ncbi:MAG: hypothetical protein NC311_03615 [Muribaculaceae bacterium]|nr:hypothetical protein [Muribaculaceae bacterium]